MGVQQEEDSVLGEGAQAVLVTSPSGLLARATDWLETLPRGVERQAVILCASSALRERLRLHVAQRLRRPGLLFGVELLSPWAWARRLLMAHGLDAPASGSSAAALRLRVGATLRDLDDLGLRYFDASQTAREPGFVEAFARTILELAEGGATPELLGKAAEQMQGADADRVRDVAAIWALSSHRRALTRAGVLRRAALVAHQGARVPALALLSDEPDATTASFLRALPQVQVVYFGARPERAASTRRRALLELPRMSLPSLVRPGANELERLKARLFDPRASQVAAMEPDGSVELEEYASFEEEVEAAAAWVMSCVEQDIPLARTALIVSRPESQVGPLLDRLRRLDPPLDAYVAGGRPRRETTGGARVLAVLDALISGLEAEATARVLPWLRASDEKVRSLSSSRCAQLIYSAGILGGTSADLSGGLQWTAKLQLRRRDYQTVLERDPKQTIQGARYEARRWIEDITPRLPAIKALETLLRHLARGVTLQDFAPLLGDFLGRWLSLPREGRGFVERLRAELEVISQEPGCASLQGHEALGALRASVANASVPWGRPARGVFIGTARQAAGVSFDAVRVLGFVEGLFPRAPMDDPVLPSDLRWRLEEVLVTQVEEVGLVALPTLEDALAEDLRAFWRVMVGVRRRLAISAPRQWLDRTDRALSSVILDVVDALGPELVQSRSASGSFLSQLRQRRLRPGTARLMERALSQAATPRSLFLAWRRRLEEDGTLPEAWMPGAAGLEDLFPSLSDLWDDEEPEDEAPPAPEEARHPEVPGLDVRRPLSASWLVRLLRCPYQFHQEKVLYRSPPSERPPTDRLSTAAMAELLRDTTEVVFARRGRWICASEGSLEEHLKFARHELFQCFMQLKRMYPLRGGDTEVAELERARRHMESLIYYEWSLPARSYLATQVGFGFDQPAQLALEGGTLHLRGRLDRLDELEEGYALRALRLGRGRPLEEEALHPERDLALGVQVLVCEQALYPDAPVLEATAVYLTPEGATERAFRGPDLERLRAQTRLWLAQAQALLEAQDFVRTPLPSDCHTCSFLRLCGPRAALRSARVLEGSQEPHRRGFLALKEGLDV